MKTTVLFLLAGMGVATCQAQTACDSLYRLAYSHPPLMTWFEIPPAIIAGRERLTTYNVPKERAGQAYFQVLIDEQGTAGCLQWLGATNAAVQAQAADVVASLRFSPGMMNKKPLKVPMALTVYFREGPPPTKRELRKKYRAQDRLSAKGSR
jgi:hypothetical protein